MIITGKKYARSPQIFERARKILNDEIIHFGYVDSRKEYERLLKLANILFVTCIQDFFGISVVEGIAAGCFPLLPDRLAYPEHLPILNREFSLYRKNEEMMPMLVHIIENKLYKDTKEFTDFVRRYEWINLIHEYDRCLEANC